MKTIETKAIYWYYEEREYEGVAEFVVDTYDDKRYIYLRDAENGDCFDWICEDMCTHGVSIDEVWDIVPDDVTDFELGY